jgi:hypothetical protein
MLFIALMALSTGAVASIAAFFSVYGLAHTFTGAFWSVVAMGSSLEAGKLMLASFTYRFKDVIGWRLKMPAYAFILVLMLITSTGIYGYLSAAYQAESAGGQQVTATLELKKQEQATLQQRKVQIDQQIAQLPTNNVRGRQQLMRQFAPEEKQIDEKLAKVNQEIQDLSQQQITSNAHIGPIVYIAKILGMDPDKAIAILICLVIFVFDPLAMLMTINTNIAIEKYQKDKAAKSVSTEPVVDSTTHAWTVEEPSGMQESFVQARPSEIEPDYGPEKTGIPTIDRYNEDYWEPDMKAEPDVMEHGSEEKPAEQEVQQEVQQEEPQQLIPPPWDEWPKFEFKNAPEPAPVVVEQEEVKPLNEEPVYEMGEAEPLNEEPVYEMQQEEVSPIQEIKQIQEEIEQKPELSKEEREMRDMIKRFFARQDLIRSTRRD